MKLLLLLLLSIHCTKDAVRQTTSLIPILIVHSSTTVPATWNRDGTFKHTLEGDDDMPGHVKSSIMGVSLNVPIQNGRLALGTWQGIYLNEHRDQGGWGGGHTRRILITLQGQS